MRTVCKGALVAALLAPAAVAANGTDSNAANSNTYTLSGAIESAAANPPAPSATDDGEEENPWVFVPYWDGKLKFKTNNGLVTMEIGGRIHYDVAFQQTTGSLKDNFDWEDGQELRRARMYIAGKFKEQGIDWKFQYEFADGTNGFRDAFVNFGKIPYVNVRAGQMKEPFSLEQMMSSNDFTFVERSSAHVLVPDRNLGVLLLDQPLDQRLNWAAGIFQGESTGGDSATGSDYNVTARLTGLPVYSDGGKKLVHLGGDFTRRQPQNGLVDLETRPEWHLGEKILNTGMITGATEVWGYGGELAATWDRFQFQGEWYGQTVENAAAADSNLMGYYAFASVFLTDDYRTYNRGNGAYGVINPSNPLGGEDGGCGAFELGLRYSETTFEDVPAGDDRMSIVSGAFNWYLNRSVRLMFDVGNAVTKQTTGGNLWFVTRFQVAF